MIVVLWGVSGCGKTTVGSAFADRFGFEFLDADDFHPRANVEKMRAGQPLTDADRLPWLTDLATRLSARADRGEDVVLACSALRARYRALLNVNEAVRFVQLYGTFQLIAERLAGREHAFMNDRLLQSQFDTLEEDPSGLRFEVDEPIDHLCARIADALERT